MTFAIEGISIRSRDDRPVLLVSGAWEDERPFQGVLAHVDWHLAGKLHGLARQDWITGSAGEQRLLMGFSPLANAGLAILGLGPRRPFDEAILRAFVDHAAKTVHNLGDPEVVLELPFEARLLSEEVIERLFDRAPTWHIVARTASGRLVALASKNPRRRAASSERT